MNAVPPPIPAPEPSPLYRFFKGAWDAVNFTRRLVFNLIFLFLLFLFTMAFMAMLGQRTAPLGDRTTLVFAPEGRLVEEYSIDPASRMIGMATGTAGANEVRLRDLLSTLEAAKADSKIERVVLKLDDFQGGSFASTRMLATKLAELRAAGKQVIAWGTYYDQLTYLLAAQADEVLLDPDGYGVMLTGISSQGLYMRGLLEDKLGLNIHVFQAGEFKSAVEPFTRDSASAEAKQADLYWMNDVWQRHVADIAQARGMQPAALNASIERTAEDMEAVGGNAAALAERHGLVDGLKSRRELEALLLERGVEDTAADGGFRQVSLGEYDKHTQGVLPRRSSAKQVAVVVAEGAIMDGEQNPGSVGGDSTAALLRQALDDDSVKAVVLRVNSPGGSAFASEVINREIIALKAAGKPVIASMGGVAASGGYWISMNADAIYADASTITGSIGVFGMIPTFENTLDKVGIKTDGVSTTRIANALNPMTAMDEDGRRIIQASISNIYREFITKVAEGRSSTPEAIDEVARGRVWSGAQAKERGLVDELGDLDAAIAEAARRAELGEPKDWTIRYIEQEPTGFARFIASLSNTRLGYAFTSDSARLRNMVVQAMPAVQSRLLMLEAALPKPGQPRTAKAVAYCFCEVQ